MKIYDDEKNRLEKLWAAQAARKMRNTLNEMNQTMRLEEAFERKTAFTVGSEAKPDF